MPKDKTVTTRRYMGQIHAECDCPTPDKCTDRCLAAEPQTTKLDEELLDRVAVTLRVLFPNEAWSTYVRSAHCLITEFNRKTPAEEKVSA